MDDLTRRIRLHYNLLAPFYYGLWGRHVHHGYWSDDDDAASQDIAQERLIYELWMLAGCPRRPTMLDVGCGFAGSLLWLARHAAASGLGLTLSPLQRVIGQLEIRRAGAARRLRVRVADAQGAWPVLDRSMTLVWCVECSEHLRDRTHLAREAFRVLKPGGALCVAAWLAAEHETAQARALRRDVERGMLCYPLDTLTAYRRMARDAGFEAIETRIVTPHVMRTWDKGIAIRDRRAIRPLSRLLGTDARAFADSFATLRRAYHEGAMEYGLLVARAPDATPRDRRP